MTALSLRALAAVAGMKLQCASDVNAAACCRERQHVSAKEASVGRGEASAEPLGAGNLVVGNKPKVPADEEHGAVEGYRMRPPGDARNRVEMPAVPPGDKDLGVEHVERSGDKQRLTPGRHHERSDFTARDKLLGASAAPPPDGRSPGVTVEAGQQ